MAAAAIAIHAEEQAPGSNVSGAGVGYGISAPASV
jgi:hypothetical protein